jgi:hypothetical protein
MKTPTVGYSGSPLVKKLGIHAGARLVARHAPGEYPGWLTPLPKGVCLERSITEGTDVLHVFADRKAALMKELSDARRTLRADAAIWVSWPKKSSKVPTDITEDVVREVALPLGFVDIKVCAVSDVWSGLKLVVRKKLR